MVSGADTPDRRAGDDYYVVNDTGDLVTESADSGIDTVRSIQDHVLEAEFENLILAGTFAFAEPAMRSTSRIVGNALSSTLDGVSAATTLVGGGGADVYVVDNSADVVVEDADPRSTRSARPSATCWRRGSRTWCFSAPPRSTGPETRWEQRDQGNAGNNTLSGGGGWDGPRWRRRRRQDDRRNRRQHTYHVDNPGAMSSTIPAGELGGIVFSSGRFRHSPRLSQRCGSPATMPSTARATRQ